MMKTSLTILSVLALAGGGFAARGAEAAAGFGDAPESLLKSGAWPGRATSALLQPVVDKAAGLTSPKALTGKLMLAGKPVPVALDAATADGELNVLRLDLENKGDFTAATVLKLAPPPPRQTTRMVDGKAETVTLPPPPKYFLCEGVIPGPAGRVFVKGTLYTSTGISKDGVKREFTSLSLRTANIRVGKVQIAGVDRAVALIDTNGNGLYNDAFNPEKPASLALQYGGGDAVMVDCGAGDFADLKQVKSVVLDRYLMLDGKAYELQVDPKGQGVTVSGAAGGQGRISFAAGNMTVQASLTGRRLSATITPQAEGMEIPVGIYQVASLQVQDPVSKARLLLRGGKPVEVIAGKNVTVPVETSLKCRISASPMTADRQIRLSALRTAGAGMTVSGVYGQDAKPAPVGFEVLGADGRKIAAGNFEFG